MKKFIFVMGPTAAGKSSWALRQALKYKAAIINCDSIQVYRDLDIGSSKPTLMEREQVPHYLFDYVSFPQEMTAGQYVRDFFLTLDKIKEDLVFVVGGTGFYFQALEQGMYPVKTLSQEIKEKIHREFQKMTLAEVFLWIQERDPIYAQKISANDSYRLERAFELMVSENKSMTQIQEDFNQAKKKFPYKYLKIGITAEKSELLVSVQKRTQQMLENGLIDEVKNLLEKGYSQWAPMTSVGYKEVVQYLNAHPNMNDIKKIENLEALHQEIVSQTMKLIKKQKTWFKRDKEIMNIDKMQTLDLNDLI
ncbi:MAG: tRNA (adenosine(37)-N6)-dimethylallyltransferase MiaA [Deltaproteobacteria bacterium]|jgi:tRNA dimethylallyltransferase|nr:tRNA (adenosine(37)-N6)-dimethylallyltransferase MiaA [Deltaproteobacteria bacterium]